MPQPPEVDRLADPLVRTIRDAWDEVISRQDALGDDPRLARRRRWLSEMERSVGSLMDEVDREAAAWLRSSFPETYGRGAVDVAAGDFTWTQPHVAAVRALAGETWDDLLQATRFVRRRTKALVRELARLEVGNTLLAGQTARQGGTNLARHLRERGVWAVTYRDGSRHGLGEYGELVVRTRSASAYNVGALNQAVGAGVSFFEVFDGADCGWTFHDDADKANGTIRSAAECAQHVLAHPNCRRSFGARPDLRRGEGARPSTTAAQREDAARFEADLAAQRRGTTSARQRRQERLDRHAAAVRRRGAVRR